MPSTENDTPADAGMASPYRTGAPVYARAGWSPIPIKRGTKIARMPGLHGRIGKYLDAVDVEGLASAFPNFNVALHLPRDVIGIDLDLYKPEGRRTFARLVAQFGPLPDTVESSARTDGSGIRLFRLPAKFVGLEFRDPRGGGVEVIDWHDSYVIVRPSVHAKLRTMYRWYRRTGPRTLLELDYAPGPEDPTMLPVRWAVGLRGSSGVPRTRAPVSSSARDTLAQLSAPSDAMCPGMSATLALWLRRVQAADPTAHDAMRDGINALLGDSVRGHRGAYRAASRLGWAFLKVRPGGSDRSTRDELRLAVARCAAYRLAEAANLREGGALVTDGCEANHG